MIDIVIKGRGGQGAVNASQILAEAFFQEGKYAQSILSFSGERRGAPVEAFTRVNDTKILQRNYVTRFDYIIIMDPNLVKNADPSGDLKDQKNGWVILNTSKKPEDFQFSKSCRLAMLNANEIARKCKVGPETFPIPNSAMLGAFSKISHLVELKTLLSVIEKYISGNVKGNQEAIIKAYEEVIVREY